MSGVIQVPGSFEAQGFGNETVQMRWQVLTGDRVKGRKGAVGIGRNVTSGSSQCYRICHKVKLLYPQIDQQRKQKSFQSQPRSIYGKPKNSLKTLRLFDKKEMAQHRQ